MQLTSSDSRKCFVGIQRHLLINDQFIFHGYLLCLPDCLFVNNARERIKVDHEYFISCVYVCRRYCQTQYCHTTDSRFVITGKTSHPSINIATCQTIDSYIWAFSDGKSHFKGWPSLYCQNRRLACLRFQYNLDSLWFWYVFYMLVMPIGHHGLVVFDIFMFILNLFIIVE